MTGMKDGALFSMLGAQLMALREQIDASLMVVQALADQYGEPQCASCKEEEASSEAGLPRPSVFRRRDKQQSNAEPNQRSTP